MLNLTVGPGRAGRGDGDPCSAASRPGHRPLDGIAFVAQDAPLYKNLPVADLLQLTGDLNRRFDHGYAQERLAATVWLQPPLATGPAGRLHRAADGDLAEFR